MSFLFPKSSSLPLIAPSPNRGRQALAEALSEEETMSFLFPKSSSLPLIAPSPNRGRQALAEALRAQGPATRLRSGRAPTILTDSRLAGREPAGTAGKPVTTAGALQDEALRASTILTDSRFAQGAGGGTELQEEARRTLRLAARLRGVRVPTILTESRLAGGEPAGDAGRPVTTAGAPKEEAHQRTEDVAFLHRRRQIRPEAQKEIDEARRNPGKSLIFRMEESRRWAIFNDRPNVQFNIDENPKEVGSAPSDREHDDGVSAVSKHDSIIEREAGAQMVDPDLVRAIMYVENADESQGALTKFFEDLGLAKTLFPMNIDPRLWAGLIGVKEGEFRKPEVNIRAAVVLIKRILKRLNDPTPAKVGSIYNFTGRESVSNYGARVQKAFDNRLWEK